MAIVDLKTKKVVREPNPEVVRILESLLEQAKSGEVQWLLSIPISDDGTPGYAYDLTYIYPDALQRSIGILAMLQMNMTEMLYEIYSDLEDRP
jgi:hypothetical protein